jgi:hypothetical protein
MTDQKDNPARLGLSAQQPPEGRPLSELVALLLALVWVAAVVVQFATSSETVLTGPLSILMTLLVVFLPLALIWGIVSTARTIRALREEAARLQVAVDAMRHAYVMGQQTSTVKPSVERKIEEIAAAQKKTESQLAMFTSRRDSTLTVPSADRKAALSVPPPAPADEQPALALGTPAEDLRAPLSVADFVRALHFPESPDDKAGFRALRLALEDRKTSRLIRAAQDVLTLLSQEGIYMDDLKPERCRPEIWRRFAAGERGRAIAGLGGVRDRSSLALTAARMREDPVFRDAAHHFLRSFDKTFAEFEANASDAELADLTETRTARAFMLFGRVTGIFD